MSFESEKERGKDEKKLQAPPSTEAAATRERKDVFLEFQGGRRSEIWTLFVLAVVCFLGDEKIIYATPFPTPTLDYVLLSLSL